MITYKTDSISLAMQGMILHVNHTKLASLLLWLYNAKVYDLIQLMLQILLKYYDYHHNLEYTTVCLVNVCIHSFLCTSYEDRACW